MGRYLETDDQLRREIRDVVADVLVEEGLITAKKEEAADDQETGQHVEQ